MWEDDCSMDIFVVVTLDKRIWGLISDYGTNEKGYVESLEKKRFCITQCSSTLMGSWEGMLDLIHRNAAAGS